MAEPIGFSTPAAGRRSLSGPVFPVDRNLLDDAFAQSVPRSESPDDVVRVDFIPVRSFPKVPVVIRLDPTGRPGLLRSRFEPNRGKNRAPNTSFEIGRRRRERVFCLLHRPRGSFAIERSCQRGSSSIATIAPTSAIAMSVCVSQGSPCVPRKSSAAAPLLTATSHSTSS